MLLGVLDHVVVGDDVAVGRDEEARAGGLRCPARGLAAGTGLVVIVALRHPSLAAGSAWAAAGRVGLGS